MLKFINAEKTAASFNGASFALDAPENWESIGDGPTREAVLAWLAEGNIPAPMDVPPPPTPADLEEVKRHLLADALVKRDALLVHLERLRTRAIEAGNTTDRNALSVAITSLENAFKDQRVVNAINGEVKPVLFTINREIGLALGAASPASLQALLALDAL